MAWDGSPTGEKGAKPTPETRPKGDQRAKNQVQNPTGERKLPSPKDEGENPAPTTNQDGSPTGAKRVKQTPTTRPNPEIEH